MEVRGLILKRGTVVDAQIIESSGRPPQQGQAKRVREPALLGSEERAIFAYKSRLPIQIQYHSDGSCYGVLDKAFRNRPLNPSQNARNTRNRWVRRYMDHPFSVIKDRYGRWVATAKTKPYL